jgi:hypothetical protein
MLIDNISNREVVNLILTGSWTHVLNAAGQTEDPKLTFKTQEAMVALNNRAKNLTESEIMALRAARQQMWPASYQSEDIVTWTINALSMHDLIGTPGAKIDQDAYDLVTGPWATVIGPCHLQDADRRGEIK